MNLAIFIALSFVNVIVSTIKSVFTVNGGKLAASFWNTTSYTINIVVIMLLSNFSMKIVVPTTLTTNFIGVFLAKLILEVTRKEKLWEIHATSKADISDTLKFLEIPFMEVTRNHKYIFYTIFVDSKEQTRLVKDLLSKNKSKYSIVETI